MIKLVLQFDNTDDLVKFLLLLQEHGMEHLINRTVCEPVDEKRKWKGIGSVDLKGKLSTIPNLRDFTY